MTPLISNEFDETARSSKRSKPDLHVFFCEIFFESNSEVPSSAMGSHLELRETRSPVDNVDEKHLEQSFPELEVTEVLH